MFGAFNVVPRASGAVLIFFHPFFFILLCFSYFHPSSCICFSASVIMLWFPPVYPLSHSVVYCWLSVLCLFLILVKYFLYLLDPSFIHFHVSLSSKILDHLSYFYSELFFKVGCLLLLHLFILWSCYHVPSSIACFFVFLFCLIYYICHPFCWLKDCSSSYLWCLPHEWGWTLSFAWLGTCAYYVLWMELYLSYEGQCHVWSSVFGGF